MSDPGTDVDRCFRCEAILDTAAARRDGICDDCLHHPEDDR